MKIVKKNLLAAIKEIREEYANETHTTKFNTCGLCKLYYSYKQRGLICPKCPMSIFHISNLGCLDRKIPASGSHHLAYYHPERKASLVEFYDKFIRKVSRTSEADLNLPNAFDFLIKIDKAVYNKHKVHYL